MTQAHTHFELFQLPVSFELDLPNLNQRYRDLQRAVHPDKFANASDQTRRLSVEKAATINEAFQILKSPQRRARYMLELQSVSFDDEKDTAIDPVFLMEQIELRETLSELKSNEDPLGNLTNLMLDIKRRIGGITDEISQQFALGKLNDEQKTSIKALVHKMQFLNKLQQEAEYEEENLYDAI